MKHPESDLQTKICKWLKKTYPGMLFFSDFAAGLYLSEFYSRLRSLQSCDDKYLDLTIMMPNDTYHALIIEIKCTDTDLFLKDGKTLKSEHVQLQYNSILKLRATGYFADFGVGEDNIKQMIIGYINNYLIPKEIYNFRGSMTVDKNNLLADKFFEQHGV